MSFFVREITRDDIKAINTWRNNREIIDSLGSPFRYVNEETDINWFNNYLANRANTVRLAICEMHNDNLIGACYLLGIDWINRSAEFAIWIGVKSSHGKGAGFFAAKEVLSHAFNDLNLNRVHLTVLSTNQPAINLYKKVGFIEEGRLRGSTFKNGCYKDMLQMSILADEFLKLQK